MNTPLKVALGLLSSGVVGIGGWALYHKLGGGDSGKDTDKGVVIKFSDEEKAAIEELGISTSSCNASEKSCNLSPEEQEKIKFSDGTNNDLKIPSNKKVELRIEKPVGKEAEIFGQNSMKLNLIFSGGGGDIEIKDSNNNNNKITLKSNTNYEFKKNNSGQLERAWKAGGEIAKKIGFSSCNDLTGNNFKNCPMLNAQINVLKGGKKIKGLEGYTEGTENSKSKNITLANSETEGFNNGFKFSSPEEIKLTTSPTEPREIITLEKGKDYEIKFIEDDWYLVLKE